MYVHEVIKQKLCEQKFCEERETEAITELKFLNNNMYLQFENIIYKQLSGAPIVSSIGSLVDEIALQEIGGKIFNEMKKQLILYMMTVWEQMMKTRNN